jgi:hypothetical protein
MTVPFAATSTTSATSPDPESVHVLPGLELQVQLKEAPVSASGSGSDTLASIASDGPEFVTVIV